MKKKGLIIAFILLIGIIGSYFFGFKLKGQDIVEVTFGQKYKEAGYSANILFLSLKPYVKVKSNINEKKIGNYEVTYTLPLKKLTRTVVVKDKTSPVITLKGEDVVSLSFGSTYEEAGYEAQDDVDGDVTEKVKIESNIDANKLGNYEISYTVEDSSKNKQTKIRKITVQDDVAPTITLKGAKNVYVKVGGSYKEEGYDANDNYDGNVTDKVKVIDNINYQKAGTYEITYEVEDSFQNKGTEKRVIHVTNTNETSTSEITYIKGILLVNKTYHLPSNYNPGVNAEAKEALTKLQNAAKEAGYDMPLLSGFRSYDTQKWLFQSYADRDGVEKASTYSARAGQSEHQTGLAFDVGSITNSYGDTDAGKWLAANAHKYGFIIRYLKGKEHITGYQYEPWHIRYINVEVATDIYNKGVTLEEYLGVA